MQTRQPKWCLRYETPQGFATPHFQEDQKEELIGKLRSLRKRKIEAKVIHLPSGEQVGAVVPGDAFNPWNYWLVG